MSEDGRAAVLASLTRRVREIGAGALGFSGRVVSTGVAAWDRGLVEGGVRAGAVVEWLVEGIGAGAEGVALAMVREAMRGGGVLVVVDSARTVGFAGLMAGGIDVERILVLRPATEKLALWSVEQALRSRVVAAVWWRVERMRSEEFRRLQLAAETGGGIGMLFRDATAQREKSWAEMRVLVSPRPTRALPASLGEGGFRRVGVEILKVRGGRSGATFELELSDDGSVLRLVSELADPAAGVRPLRA